MIENIAAGLFAFWTGMLGHLWQVTLILAPLFVLDRWLRRAPSEVIHLIWSAGLIKLLLPLAVFGGLARSVMRLFPEAAQPLVSSPSNPALTAVTTVLTVPGAGAAPGTESHWLVWIVMGATAVWIAGVAGCLTRLAGEITAMRACGSDSAIPLRDAEAIKLRRALDRAGIPAGRVRIDGTEILPSVTGLLKPVVRLPHRLVASLPDDELLAVLVHEDAHRRRFDPLRALTHRLCASLFFFYPLIWPLLRRL
ncbi:MAG: M56 family metallopeptidase, partial [bacterium]